MERVDPLVVRHLIVALERVTNGRLRDAQRNLEYARARLAEHTQWIPTADDLGFGCEEDV